MLPNLMRRIAPAVAIFVISFRLCAEPDGIVGSKVAGNMDALSMVLSLLLVLVLIVASAWLLKRFNLVQQGQGQLKVVTSLALSTKERLMVVQVGDKQLLLGVTAQQITLLDTLAEPITVNSPGQDVSASLLKLIKK